MRTFAFLISLFIFRSCPSARYHRLTALHLASGRWLRAGHGQFIAGYSGSDLGRGDSTNFTEKYNPRQCSFRNRVADVISLNDGLLPSHDRNSSFLAVFGHANLHGAAGSRVSLVVQGKELVHRDMRIFLRSAKRGMPQHFLDRSQVRSLVEKVRSKRMAQDMRAYGAARERA